jgi:hypothetical protein
VVVAVVVDFGVGLGLFGVGLGDFGVGLGDGFFGAAVVVDIGVVGAAVVVVDFSIMGQKRWSRVLGIGILATGIFATGILVLMFARLSAIVLVSFVPLKTKSSVSFISTSNQ